MWTSQAPNTTTSPITPACRTFMPNLRGPEERRGEDWEDWQEKIRGADTPGTRFCARRRPPRRAIFACPAGRTRARVRRGTTSRHKVTLVGLGRMGQRHARVLRALRERFDLVGASDVRGAVPPHPGLTRVRSEAEAIPRSEVVVVATRI